MTFSSAWVEAQSAEFAIDEGGSASHETPFIAGIQDGEKIETGASALAKDTDGNSVDDGEELEMGLNPLEEDCPAWLCNRVLPNWPLRTRPGGN